LFIQNYSLSGLQQHTNYILTLAAKNLEGMGPEDSIQLRTEDGGNYRGYRVYVEWNMGDLMMTAFRTGQIFKVVRELIGCGYVRTKGGCRYVRT
jgi:hypothetical protein